MLKVKYFAYGSNISIKRLKNRVGSIFDPLVPGIPYTLENYELVFNAGSIWGPWAFANIQPKKGFKVEGILYDMSPSQFKKLDGYEILYDKHYFQIDKNTLGCVYIANNENITIRPKKPTLEYLNIIIDGCKETGLINTYNSLIDYKIKNFKIRKSKHSKKFKF